MRSSRFRYDINALRALAILGVIVFHFNSNWLAGGFAGVDVFFVISGFLMTRIIFRGLEQNNFKLFAFYVARVNRIIPALVFMCMLFLALGTIYLSPLDLASLARSTTYTLSFISNHQYLKETGYFDPAAQSKLLLHTWSLSVEWQFYLIYPLALLVLRQILSLVSIEKLIVVMTLIGFAIMQYYAHTNLSTAFYALHSRFWEMLVGGLAYCYPIKMPSNLQRIVSGSGIFAIVLSYCLAEQGSWPSLLTLLPVGGAYLVIAANCNHNKLFNHPLSQWLGLRSYSLYLWHWPIVVIAYLYQLPYAPYWGIPLALMLAEVSYRLVEQFHWQTFHRWTDLIKVKPVILALLLIGCGKFINKHNFIFSDYTLDQKDKISKLDSFFKNPEYRRLTKNNEKCINRPVSNACAFGDKSWIVVGDSFAGQLGRALLDASKHEGFLFLIKTQCPLVSPKIWFGSVTDCMQYNENRIKYLSSVRNKNIIVSVNYAQFNDPRPNKNNANFAWVSFAEQIKMLLKNNKVFLVYPIPKSSIEPKKIALSQVFAKFPQKNIFHPAPSGYILSQNMGKKLDKLLPKSKNLFVIKPTDHLCKDGSCYIVKDNRILYVDKSHLSYSGAKIIVNTINKASNYAL